jgi:two-component system, cell cycle sensor histidine kinase and response regulator CckA
MNIGVTRMAETILVVDDDQDIRFVAQQGLLARGYAVLETGDPLQAIRMAKNQTIHLLLTDVVMPIMKGTELADRIQAICPTTKVLLMAGYQTSDIAPSGRPFMAKPFSIDVLVERVRQTLERPSLFARAAKPPPGRLKAP